MARIAFLWGMDAASARASLTREGWAELARGDWAWVYHSPDGQTVARVTPWDAAYRLHAETCWAHAGHPHLPRVAEIIPLTGDGYAVVMERLWPCGDSVRAESFCAALGMRAPPRADAAEPDLHLAASFRATPALGTLRAILEALFARAASLPFFGGSDIRPGNLMCDAAGVLKVIDPIFVAGPRIVAAINAGDSSALRGVSLANLEAFLTIPAFAPGAETEALRARLKAVY